MPLQLKSFLNRKASINCRGRLIDLTTPKVMGIINITPDSFFSGSRFNGDYELLSRVESILNEGGAMLDVGAYSTRPGAACVSAEEEISRLMPALTVIRNSFPGVVISVDTFRSEIAQKVVREAEVDIINDISGGDMDEAMFDTVAALNVPYVLMHIQGTPQTMQEAPFYKNVVADVSFSLSQKVDRLREKGVNDIIIDPGFGFGKTLEHNYELLNQLEELNLFQLPILVGLSRKSMIYKLLNISAEQALNGTSILNTMALYKGAGILRVHDVKEATECVKLVEKLKKSEAQTFAL
jgi:dihydropteroate synthase